MLIDFKSLPVAWFRSPPPDATVVAWLASRAAELELSGHEPQLEGRGDAQALVDRASADPRRNDTPSTVR